MNTLDQHLFAHLQRQRSLVMDRGLLVIFLVALIPAAYPFFFYVTGSPIWTLPLLGTAIFAAHIALTLRTLMLATSPQLWDNQWDLFALTGIPAHAVIHAQWHRLVQLTWRYHVLFALLRLGLAVGAAQLLQIACVWTCDKYNLGGLCYIDDSPIGGMYQAVSPSILKMLVAAMILMPLAVLESGLISALSLLASINLQHSSNLRAGLVLLWRALFTAIVIGCFFGLSYGIRQSDEACRYDGKCYGAWVEIQRMGYNNLHHELHFLSAALETIQIGGTVIADNGVTLAADLMRPTWGILSIVRNVPMFALGVILYRWLTRGILRLAARQAIQRGLLP